jgi:hypothetical protein
MMPGLTLIVKQSKSYFEENNIHECTFFHWRRTSSLTAVNKIVLFAHEKVPDSW